MTSTSLAAGSWCIAAVRLYVIGRDLLRPRHHYPTRYRGKCERVTLYDALVAVDVVEQGTEVEMQQIATDNPSERDELPRGVRKSREKEHAALKYPARVDPRPLLVLERRLGRENRGAVNW
ncbi:hypothetical protein CYMTET_45267 [Cymbomonas tetramitiformis]|uniref:Uncharacterized protein n=1 Tax=Cymbomonas tetramitiformis TaxID=36881 RepID=A0AAE0EWI1_9CHLO|nr:hypothetical protein CYMTET_48738 [Cymbomonas tetramitiformis]KAK3245145.1 hypothetical protein CYMTET_45267 [Cymbomonas tetramitiformis]